VKPGGDADALVKEVQALSSVHSKHVVQLYDVLSDKSGSSVGVVLEYIPGRDLTEFQTSDTTSLLKVLYQLSCGIADIHGAGLIHRDVKPKNAKFDNAGILKLFDFALSCATEDAETTAARGTTPYRAPEFYEKPPINFTKSIDAYAFGVIAWWLAEQSLRSELRSVPPRAAPSFGTCSVNFPIGVVTALDATLECDPTKRAHMRDVRDVIAKHLLYGKHNASISDGAQTLVINKIGQSARLNLGGIGSTAIAYDGLDFSLSQVSGDVYVNGVVAQPNLVLPQSCVIIIGAPNLGSSRKFATFDVSHPEVVL
jgi:serine/threonine-protein kinase